MNCFLCCSGLFTNYRLLIKIYIQCKNICLYTHLFHFISALWFRMAHPPIISSQQLHKSYYYFSLSYVRFKLVCEDALIYNMWIKCLPQFKCSFMRKVRKKMNNTCETEIRVVDWLLIFIVRVAKRPHFFKSILCSERKRKIGIN